MSCLPDPPKTPYLRFQDPDGIRVLVLRPGRWSDPIKCELKHESLSRHRRYHALSYAWGKSNSPRPVTVDGIAMQVTINLESALRHLRRRDEPLILWVDALVRLGCKSGRTLLTDPCGGKYSVSIRVT